MHTVMAYTMVLAREYPKPAGTVLRNSEGVDWRIISSSLPSFWKCKLEVCRIDNSQAVTTVVLPNMDWTITSIPNPPPKPEITYLNQATRPSTQIKVPTLISDMDLLFGDHKWTMETNAASLSYLDT